MGNMQKFVLIIVCLNTNINFSDGQIIKCEAQNWKCNNGECISNNIICDGIGDCSDDSDENVDFCRQLNATRKAPNAEENKERSKRTAGAYDRPESFNDNKRSELTTTNATNAYGPPAPAVSKRVASNTYDRPITNAYDPPGANAYGPPAASAYGPPAASAYGPPAASAYGPPAPVVSNRVALDSYDSPATSEYGRPVPLNAYETTTNAYQRPKTTATAAATTTTTTTTTSTTTTTVSPTQTGCRVTFKPNLIVNSEGDNPEEILPGDYVKDFEIVKYSCQETNLLVGPTANYCVDNKWAGPVPTCQKYCSNKVLLSPTIQSICEHDGTVSCRLPILPGTRATISCQFGYQKTIFEAHDHLYCGEDGKWDYAPYRCQQVCGAEQPDLNPFIFGGSKTNNTKVPWHVGIYSSLKGTNQQICGGTIVSARIVISAAHCFWNVTNSQVNDNSLYKVAAGKYYRNYDDTEKLAVQFSDIEQIHIPEEYQDQQLSYISDIAVLVLKTFIRFNFYIKPACIKWDLYSEKAMKSNLIGRVAGWGITETGLPSNELNSVELPTLSYVDCLEKLKKEHKSLITGDKFCVSGNGGQVCQGDSGGGFLIPIVDVNGVTRFVLQGIVSNGINSNEECTGDFLTAYTNLQYFEKMVESYLDKYRLL